MSSAPVVVAHTRSLYDAIHRRDFSTVIAEVRALCEMDRDLFVDPLVHTVQAALVRVGRGRRPSPEQVRALAEGMAGEAAEWIDGMPSVDEFEAWLRTMVGYPAPDPESLQTSVLITAFATAHVLRYAGGDTPWQQQLDEIEQTVRARDGVSGWLDDFLDPRYPYFLLVWTGEWMNAEANIAECAMMTAPTVIRPGTLGPDALKVVAFAENVAVRTGQRLLFFSELTRLLTAAHDSWAARGVDWQAALADLENSAPLVHLALDRWSWHIASSPALTMIAADPGGSVELRMADEHQALRQRLLPVVSSGWATYIDGLLRPAA